MYSVIWTLFTNVASLWPAEHIVLYVIRGNTGTINKFTLNIMTHEPKQQINFDLKFDSSLK
jgi:hypothetical protein